MVSDIHFERALFHGVDESFSYDWLRSIVRKHEPDSTVMLGDMGHAWASSDWADLAKETEIHAIYGNHDNLVLLQEIRNDNGSPILARDGERIKIGKHVFGFINGIQGSKEKEGIPRKGMCEFFQLARKLKGVDVLCMHDSPIRDPRINPYTRNPRPIYDIVKTVSPRISFAGHINTPYAVGYMEKKIIYVNLDSSARSQFFAILDTKNMQVKVLHDNQTESFVSIAASMGQTPSQRLTKLFRRRK